MNNDRLIWLNGEIVPVAEAKINVLSPTSQFGANVFEGIRCYWNSESQQLYCFKLDEHIQRLQNSVKLIGFESSYTSIELKKHFFDVIKANNYREDIAVRQTVFLGGFGSWYSVNPVEMFIAPIPISSMSQVDKSGLSCCISTWERINDRSMSPKIKVGANYINSRMGQLEAMRNGYDTTIFLNNQGQVSEGPGSCIFIVRHNKLITPPISASILESITRETIIHIAQHEIGLSVVERCIDRTELYIADEIFLCGTAMEIKPIFNIDKTKVGNGDIGEITNKLQKLYLNIVRGNVNKYKNWLTPVY